MKPGDIVTLNANARTKRWYPRWKQLNGDRPMILGSFLEGYDGAFRVKGLDYQILWDEDEFGTKDVGVSICFLEPQPFLTAVKNAIEKEK